MGIPIGITVKASTDVLKPAICEYCGAKFVYLKHVEVTGAAISPLLIQKKRASEKAQERAAKGLQFAVANDLGTAFAPCPLCGKLASQMIRQRRQVEGGVIVLIFLGLILADAFVTVKLDNLTRGVPSWSISWFAVAFIAAACALIWVFVHDHNANPLKNLTRYGKKSMLMKDFEAIHGTGETRKSDTQAPL